MPHLLWLGAHALEHHEHGDEEWPEHARVLVHGHEHPEGVPDHEHDLVPSPPLRQDPPRELQAPDVASLEAPAPARLQLAGDRPWRRVGLSGSSPPRLHLLCTLLI